MVSENGTVVATFIYDGDGNRVKKTEAGETVLYINRYYEKNLTTGNVTTSYYLGSRLVAQREGEDVRFIHQDHLSGTSLTTTDNGTVISSIKYFPYGDTRSGDVPTDVKFTGQRLDSVTGLYYYGARYYDPLIGRFISADTIIPDPMNPQAFNRYTYCLNNPLKYVDPSGHFIICGIIITTAILVKVTVAVIASITLKVALDNVVASNSRKSKTKIIPDFRVPDFSLAYPTDTQIFHNPKGGQKPPPLKTIAQVVATVSAVTYGVYETQPKNDNLPITEKVDDTYEPTQEPVISTSPDTSETVDSPVKTYLVIFTDGNSGYFTMEQIGAMVQVGAPIAEIK